MIRYDEVAIDVIAPFAPHLADIGLRVFPWLNLIILESNLLNIISLGLKKSENIDMCQGLMGLEELISRQVMRP